MEILSHESFCPVCGGPTSRRVLSSELSFVKAAIGYDLNLSAGDFISVLCDCQRKKQQEKAFLESQQRDKERIARSIRNNLPEKYREMVFSSDDGKNVRLRNYALKFVENFDSFLREGKGLLFYGDLGTGKTFYASCIVNSLLGQNRHADIIVASQILDLFAPGNEENRIIFYDHLRRFDLIVLDDFGASRDNEYGWERIYEVVNQRLTVKKPLLITTNYSLQEMKNEQDLKKKRVFDRLFEMTIPVSFQGQSKRSSEQQEKSDELIRLLKESGGTD